MFAAMALAATIYATPGTTYWSVSEQTGVSVTAIAADNPYPATDIPVGAPIHVPGGTASAPAISSSSASPSGTSSGGSQLTGSSSASSSFQIPGLSASLSNCIAQHESNGGQTSWNVFQILPGSGFIVTPGMSLTQQEQVAGQVAAADGAGAWTRFDGC